MFTEFLCIPRHREHSASVLSSACVVVSPVSCQCGVHPKSCQCGVHSKSCQCSVHSKSCQCGVHSRSCQCGVHQVFCFLQRVITTELGPDWKDQLQTFDDKPFAAASIGQVHRGVLQDGRPVAMKIQVKHAVLAHCPSYKIIFF